MIWKIILRSSFLTILLMLLGCVVEISQPTSASPSTNPGSGTETATITTATRIPITWGNLNLSGKLVYVTAVLQGDGLLVAVRQLDLVTGGVTTIFQTPDGGWVDGEAVSPDAKRLIISYAPSSGEENLYDLPADGSALPKLLIPPSSKTYQYFEPVWSPDGKYLYFVRIDYHSPTVYTIMRMAYPDGQPEQLVSNAYWPRVSNDGSRLTYVGLTNGANLLYIANADGSQSQQVPLTGPSVPAIIDAPMFLADDQTILFSAPVFGQSYEPGWADKLLGLTAARADGVIPSDWWSVPLSGGDPVRLTHLQSLALYPCFSPDKSHIASYSGDGIFIMNPDGSAVTQVVNYTGGITGSISWIP